MSSKTIDNRFIVKSDVSMADPFVISPDTTGAERDIIGKVPRRNNEAVVQPRKDFNQILEFVDEKKFSAFGMTTSRRWVMLEDYRLLKMKQENNTITEQEKQMLVILEKAVL
jgi:hypothetical protein